jgi:hypothetical protein
MWVTSRSANNKSVAGAAYMPDVDAALISLTTASLLQLLR